MVDQIQTANQIVGPISLCPLVSQRKSRVVGKLLRKFRSPIASRISWLLNSQDMSYASNFQQFWRRWLYGFCPIETSTLTAMDMKHWMLCKTSPYALLSGLHWIPDMHSCPTCCVCAFFASTETIQRGWNFISSRNSVALLIIPPKMVSWLYRIWIPFATCVWM